MKKKYLIVVSTGLITSVAYSQSDVLKFTYDAAGNQTKREFKEEIAARKLVIPTEEELEEVIAPISARIQETIPTSVDAFILYPNPTKGNIVLQWQASVKDVAIVLSDTQGRILKEAFLTEDTMQFNLDITDFPSGVYLLSLHDQKGDRVVRKIIKN